MNAVQAHLDDFTSWDRLYNRTFTARSHLDPKTCQIARICPNHFGYRDHVPQMIDTATFVRTELQLALMLLNFVEERRILGLARPRAANPDLVKSEQQMTGKEDEVEKTDSETVTRERKQDINAKLNVVADDLTALRESVQLKLGVADLLVTARFYDLGEKILKIMET